MAITKWNNAEKYAAQSDIVNQALSTSEHSLHMLLDLMRGTGQAAVYLLGSRVDHDYCLGSEDVGILLSVLPEDAQKAAVPGYHPGSSEVYITFQGSLNMECFENDRVIEKTISHDHPLIIPPGQCHRVAYAGGRQAAYVIVKTHLSHKPGVVRCDTCGYFADRTLCALYQRWNAEMKSTS